MLFSEKYPIATIDDGISEECPAYIGTSGICFHCKQQQTNFADICFEGYICSEECLKAADDGYYKALAAKPKEVVGED